MNGHSNCCNTSVVTCININDGMQGSAEELFEGESYTDYSSFEESSQSEDLDEDTTSNTVRYFIL